MTCKCVVTYDELDEAIYSAKKKIKHLSEEVLRNYVYGYACNSADLLNRISLLLDSVEQYRNSFVRGVQACLECKDFQTILEELRTLTSDCDRRSRIDQIVDLSGREAWVLQNPYCAPKERWQQLALKLCSDLKFNIKITDKSEKLLCDLLYKVAITQKDCSLGYKVDIDIKDCKIEYDSLVKDKNCDITFTEYVKLKECGIDYDIISTAKDCGLDITYNLKDKCAEIEYEANSCQIVGTQVSGIPDIPPPPEPPLIECCEGIPLSPSMVLSAIPINVLCVEDEPTIGSQQGVSVEGGCGEVNIFWIGDAGSGPCPKMIFRSWIAQDECGNLSATTVQVITVDDRCVESECAAPCPCPETCCDEIVGSPTINLTCPADAVYSCLSDVPAPDTGELNATGGCGELILDWLGDGIQELCPRIILRYYSAGDECQNRVICSQTITVTLEGCEGQCE